MRKRRAILFDDDPAILMMLTIQFEGLGYEVVTFGDSVSCPIYRESDRCVPERPCADLMITDLEMPGMSGLEMLERQSRRGCRLNVRNKAVLSGNLNAATNEAIRNLGCASFQKPCPLSTLAAWARECEQRMDLTQPLGVIRKERREAASGAAILNAEGQEADLYLAEVVNRSVSGLCLRVDKTPTVAQILNLQTRMPLPSARLDVRWTLSNATGGCLAGALCC